MPEHEKRLRFRLLELRAELRRYLYRVHGSRDFAKRIGHYDRIRLVAREARSVRRSISRCRR